MDFTTGKAFSLDQMPEIAKVIRRGLDRTFTDKTFEELATAQVLDVAEEAGEFVGAFRRFMGCARRSGSYEDMYEELADVVIASFSAAEYLGIDLKQALAIKSSKVLSRGFKEE